MDTVINDRIESLELDLARAKNVRRVYRQVRKDMEDIAGREFRDPNTGKWFFHEFTDVELEKGEYTNPFTGEIDDIWDSKEDVKQLVDIYKELLEFLAKIV